jgi:hypothetical protein
MCNPLLLSNSSNTPPSNPTLLGQIFMNGAILTFYPEDNILGYMKYF